MNHSHPDGRLVLASQNRHKLAELRDLLARAGLDPTLLEPAPPGLEVVEDGETFAENAIKKAVTVARITGCRALADDSGLEVEALDGHPGVRSARFAGEPANDENNNRKILELLAGQSNRRARFRCVLALSDAEGRTRTVEGRCEGVLGLSPRGKNGFGYDP
ncbi:MAG: non-canonical purine NTP pyrophosphatase, partial [Kiritimatiellia bacterium]|nr:non-canonical purine NTP pyrophosphatase [Kiritimatiellia bacterium]